MKRKSRALALVLCAAVMLGALATGAFAAGSGNFTKINDFTEGAFADVGPDDWYFDNVKSAYEFGLMKGVGDGAFDPGGELSVAEAMTIAARLHSIYTTGEESFEQGSPWYQTYVDYDVEHGIISAEHPDCEKTATRAEFAVILAGALPDEALTEINSVAAGAIPDVKTEDEFAGAVYKLYRAGVLTGDGSGAFSPESNILRCEVAAVVSRMADPALRREVELGDARQDAAIASALREKYRSDEPDGLLHIQSFILLGEGETDGAEKVVFLLVYHAEYAMSGGPKAVSDGFVPTALTFEVGADGEYALKDYWTPGGADIESEVRARFPAFAADKALDVESYTEALKADALARATAYPESLQG